MPSTMMTTRGQLAFDDYAKVLVENGGRRKEWENLTHHQRLAWQCAAQSIAESVTVAEAQANEAARRFFEADDDDDVENGK